MKDLILKQFEESELRIIERGQEIWFVANDVCNVLEVRTNDTLNSLDDDEKGYDSIVSPGGTQKMAIINEAGLYSTILRSRKPEAKKFKRWITHEVLPSIREKGAYSIGVPKTLSEALFMAAEQAKKIEEQDRYIESSKPKIDFFDSVADSKDAIEMGSVAKVLNRGIGRNRLFDFLRKKGVLLGNNEPSQRYIDAGYFRTIEQKFTKNDGSTCINIKTLVYQKGIQFIQRLLDKE